MAGEGPRVLRRWGVIPEEMAHKLPQWGSARRRGTIIAQNEWMRIVADCKLKVQASYEKRRTVDSKTWEARHCCSTYVMVSNTGDVPERWATNPCGQGEMSISLAASTGARFG